MAPSEISKPAIKTPLKKINSELRTTRPRTSTVPKIATPNARVQKSNHMIGNMSQSTKKPICKRRPLPAHSGVPITEKMKESIRKGFAEMKLLTEVSTPRPQTATAPKVVTPKPKIQKPVQTGGNVVQSTKKAICKRRPLPAHSGVPITDKMKEQIKKDLVGTNQPKEVRITRQRTSLAPTRERTSTMTKDIASNTKPKGAENVPPSAKKTWKLPAHHGVPITEKMKQSLRRGFVG